MITHVVSRSGLSAEQFEPSRVRSAIHAVEGMFSQMETLDLKTEHMFVPGLYFRRLDLPAGSFNTGKLHAQDDGLIIASGKVTFLTEHGEHTLEGPCMVTVKANTKPLVHAWTDVVMFSAHLNLDNCTDPEVIERRVIIPNELGVCNEDKEVIS